MPNQIGRREFIKATVALGAGTMLANTLESSEAMKKPNILFIMTDQQRFDTIASLGNSDIYTPNLDRLVKRGITFTNCYSTCPECVPARATIRTGCEPNKTLIYGNAYFDKPNPGQAPTIEGRCGLYLAKTMKNLGYRTFGIGKFHTIPWDEDLGYDVHLHSEEIYKNADQRFRDSYSSWIAKEHSEFNFIEGLMGERTEMYYMPQMSTMPAEMTVERWAADRAVEQIKSDSSKPYFGFVSFVGPHPPFAPPIPFNRMYDPDKMPNPLKGDINLDHMDEHIPWMNHLIWAEDINNSHARVLKARYYGEITYIDNCLGHILDAVDSTAGADNTLICFYADHGEHLGDHNAWQKESFFEASCKVPMLLSWPAKLPAEKKRDELVALTDLFGIATNAAGASQPRDGIDVLDMLDGKVKPRESLIAYFGKPGENNFKVMLRKKQWKYIYIANGGRQQLFNIKDDPDESRNCIESNPDLASELRKEAVSACKATSALKNNDFIEFPFEKFKYCRIYQFDLSRGIKTFPKEPKDVTGVQNSIEL